MSVITKDEFLHNKDYYIKKIKDGAVFLHPTDTIYGLGCDATNEEAVKKIREIKKRNKMPFSVIAPSKEWISHHCAVSAEAKEWIGKLPGPYTFILRLKSKASVAPSVNLGADTLGIRIPENWFAEFVSELNIPVVSTSANITGQTYMTTIDDLDSEIKVKLDFLIYEGEKGGRPSTIVKLHQDPVESVER